MAVARIHVRAWQEGYRGLIPAGFLEQMRPEDRAPRYTFGRPTGPQTTVALRDGSIVGFATVIDSELAALHVDPSAWRSGIGTALIAHARSAIAATGASEAHLWLLAGNSRAQRFYERDGWHVTDVQRQDTVWNVTVDEVQLRRRLP